MRQNVYQLEKRKRESKFVCFISKIVSKSTIVSVYEQMLLYARSQSEKNILIEFTVTWLWVFVHFVNTYDTHQHFSILSAFISSFQYKFSSISKFWRSCVCKMLIQIEYIKKYIKIHWIFKIKVDPSWNEIFSQFLRAITNIRKYVIRLEYFI